MHARSSGLQAMEVADGGGAKVDGLVVESPENISQGGSSLWTCVSFGKMDGNGS